MVEPIGRLVLANGSIVRLVFTPEGLKMSVSQEAIDAKSLIITPISEEITFVGVPK